MLRLRLALALALLAGASESAKRRRVEYYSSSGARVLSPLQSPFPLYRAPFTAGGGIATTYTSRPGPGRTAEGKKDEMLPSPPTLFATDDDGGSSDKMRRKPSAELRAASSATAELEGFIRSMSPKQLDALVGLARARDPHYAPPPPPPPPRRAPSALAGAHADRELEDAMSAAAREEQELELSFSRAAPVVVAPSAPSPYQPERLAHLPLADYKERPKHLSSYSVPHYSVTSDSSGAGAAEGAGESQLKAVGIWTHRSRGAAYTLHPDGTLSLEPAAPRPPAPAAPPV